MHITSDRQILHNVRCGNYPRYPAVILRSQTHHHLCACSWLLHRFFGYCAALRGGGLEFFPCSLWFGGRLSWACLFLSGGWVCHEIRLTNTEWRAKLKFSGKTEARVKVGSDLIGSGAEGPTRLDLGFLLFREFSNPFMHTSHLGSWKPGLLKLQL